MGHAPSHLCPCFSSGQASHKSIRKRNIAASNPHTSKQKFIISPISATIEDEQPISPIRTNNERTDQIEVDSEYPESSWAWLPAELVAELVGSIAEKLSIGDYIRLRAVCSSWAKALALCGNQPCNHFPWLMLRQGPYSFLSLPDNHRTYHFPSETEYTECIGSRDGWLVVLHGLDQSILFLLNPITGSQIDLPPFSPNVHIRKIVLSNTDGSNFIIVVVYGLVYYKLAFMKVGETNTTSWAPLELSLHMERDRGVEDVVCHNGLFFAISSLGQVEAFDLYGPSPVRSSFPNSFIVAAAQSYSHSRYLVSSFGDLLHVWMDRDARTRTSRNFTIMKFNPEMAWFWEEIKDLGTRSLFLDSRQSMSLCARDVKGVKGNCIYFTNEHWNSRDKYISEVGVFDIEKRTIQPCFSEKLEFNCSQHLPLIWFKPSLP